MKLKWWLVKNNVQATDLAKTAMISRSYLSLIKERHVKCSFKTAILISRATGGQVSADEIINPENYPDPI